MLLIALCSKCAPHLLVNTSETDREHEAETGSHPHNLSHDHFTLGYNSTLCRSTLIIYIDKCGISTKSSTFPRFSDGSRVPDASATKTLQHYFLSLQ